jgi:hypothetical protein
MAQFQNYAPDGPSAGKKYRLAWIGSSPQNPNPCGRPFDSLKDAQEAATAYNEGRTSRHQTPCNYIVEYEAGVDPRSNQKFRLPTNLFQLDGTPLRVGPLKLGSDPFNSSSRKGI